MLYMHTQLPCVLQMCARVCQLKRSGCRLEIQTQAAEMHKKYAPAPKEQPMEVDPSLRDK